MQLKRPKKRLDLTFDSSRVKKKPPNCQTCINSVYGAGFVKDRLVRKPKIQLVKAMPAKWELLPGAATLSSVWYERVLIPAGFSRYADDINVTNLLRCYRNDFPTGKVLRGALQCCAVYDESRFVPTVALITLEFNYKNLNVPAFMTLLVSDFIKARRMAEAGERPLVLMGNEVMKFYAPWATPGGAKKWRGHWWRLSK